MNVSAKFHGNPSYSCRDISLETTTSHGIREKVRGPLKSLGIILCIPWMSCTSFCANPSDSTHYNSWSFSQISRFLQLLCSWCKWCLCLDACLSSVSLHLRTVLWPAYSYSIQLWGFFFMNEISKAIMPPFPDYLCCYKHWPQWLFTVMWFVFIICP